MSLIKWDPFEGLSELQSEIDRVFDRKKNILPQGTKLQTDWLPAVDVYEDKESIRLDVEAPGIEEDKFNIKVENNVLSIKGDRENKVEKKDKNFYRVERSYGSFVRSFELPDYADANKINAEYKNGVLHINIAKKESAQPKQVEVKVS